jgi:glyoxylase I family protein
MSFVIKDLHHASLLVSNLDQAVDFYHGILRLPLDDSRPDLGYPGAWLRLGSRQLHLMQLPAPAPVRGRVPGEPGHGGRDRHIAMTVSDLDSLMERLAEAAIPFTLSRSGRRALFCRDPDGNALEFVEQRDYQDKR